MFIQSRILTVLDCMPVVACLLCIRYLEKTFYPGHFSSGKAAAVTLILVVFLYYLAAFTEELGRLLCGLLTGYKFSSFSFGRFTLAKQRGKLRLCRTSSKKLNCIMVPPPMENGRFPYKLYYLGGSIFNLLLAACAAFLAVRFRVVPLALCAAAEAAFLFFWSALINFIPLRTENYINHACSAVMAGKTEESLYRCHAKLNRLAAELSGVRMRDMPKDWLHMPRDYELRMADGAEEAFQLHCKRMDEHRFTEALEIADRIFAQNTEGPFPLQGDLLNNCVYLCLMEDKSAADYKTPAWELFRSHNGGNLAALRTEYAMALLYGNDAEAARKIRLQFERVALRYPALADVETERELMELAAKKHRKEP